jgi:transcriptional regulator with XRE-family HTH domain
MINRIEQIKNDTGLSQKDFAKSIGMAGYAYSKLKSKINKPQILQIDQACRIALAYNVNLNWLLLGVGEKYAINNNFDSAFKQLINTNNNLNNDDLFVKKLLIDNILINIDNKIKIKETLNQRPLFMLRQILINYNNNNIAKYKEFLISKINQAKDPFISTNEKLLYKINSLTEEECSFIVKNNTLFIKLLEKKVKKLDLILIDFLDIFPSMIKNKFHNLFKTPHSK